MLIFPAGCCCNVQCLQKELSTHDSLFQEHQREHEREPPGAGDPGQPQQDGGLQVPRPQPRPRPGPARRPRAGRRGVAGRQRHPAQVLRVQRLLRRQGEAAGQGHRRHQD